MCARADYASAEAAPDRQRAAKQILVSRKPPAPGCLHLQQQDAPLSGPDKNSSPVSFQNRPRFTLNLSDQGRLMNFQNPRLPILIDRREGSWPWSERPDLPVDLNGALRPIDAPVFPGELRGVGGKNGVLWLLAQCPSLK